MSYRLSAQQLFLTYPQCNAAKETIKDALLVKLAPWEPDLWCVAHELHKNGDDHIHAYITLKKKPNWKDSKCCDVLGFHGNYQGCRSCKGVLKYCSKEDDYVANFDVAEALSGNKLKREAIFQKIIKKEMKVENAPSVMPSLLKGYRNLKADVDEYFRDQDDKRGDMPKFLPNPWGKVLVNENNKKKRHYWIFSREPNQGKTRMFGKPLHDKFKCHYKTDEFTYWGVRGDEQCIIIDEFNTAKLKFTQLNSLADGNFDFRIFQGGLRRLKDPLIIILSNKPISEIYPYMNELIYARFNEIEVKLN